MGEDLDTMSQKELHNLEQQLETSLKHVRSRKVCSRITAYCLTLTHIIYIYTLNNQKADNVLQNQLMYETISELQKKVTWLHKYHTLFLTMNISNNIEIIFFFLKNKNTVFVMSLDMF